MIEALLRVRSVSSVSIAVIAALWAAEVEGMPNGTSASSALAHDRAPTSAEDSVHAIFKKQKAERNQESALARHEHHDILADCSRAHEVV